MTLQSKGLFNLTSMLLFLLYFGMQRRINGSSDLSHDKCLPHALSCRSKPQLKRLRSPLTPVQGEFCHVSSLSRL